MRSLESLYALDSCWTSSIVVQAFSSDFAISLDSFTPSIYCLNSYLSLPICECTWVKLSSIVASMPLSLSIIILSEIFMSSMLFRRFLLRFGLSGQLGDLE